MILAGTFNVDTAGYAHLEAASLMVTDANGFPSSIGRISSACGFWLQTDLI